MDEKAVVIGSNSFSGSHFVDYLLGQGMEVAGISRSPEPDPVFLPYKKRRATGFTFFQMDLNHDLPEIVKTTKRFNPRYVINFAGQGMVAESWRNPEHWFQTNTVANVRLHDQLRRFEFIEKYVHISTPEVYGSMSEMVKENAFYNPTTPYAASKAAADMSLMAFYKAYAFPVVFTRAANVYGPGQQLYRIIPRAVLFFFLKKKLALHGGGQAVRSFVHIRDVADGTLRAARDGEAGEIFHLAHPKTISIIALVKMILEQVGGSIEENVEMVDDRLGKDAAYLLDCSKARDVLGWEAMVDIEQGIGETIAWVRDNLEVLKTQPMNYVHKP